MAHGATIHDRHVRMARPVGFEKSPPVDDGNVQHFEEGWAHNPEIRFGHGLPRRVPLSVNLEIAGHGHVGGKRNHHGGSCRFDAALHLHLLQQSFKEARCLSLVSYLMKSSATSIVKTFSGWKPGSTCCSFRKLRNI